MNNAIEQPAVENLRLKENLITIKTGQGDKPYLRKEKAVNMFRRDYPIDEGRGAINTIMLSAEPPIFRAEIYIDGVMVASGHASPEGQTTSFRKVESAAIRRALENAGYGADAIIQHIADSIGVEEANRLLGSGGNGKERRMGSDQKPATKPQQPKPPVVTSPPANPYQAAVEKAAEVPKKEWTPDENTRFWKQALALYDNSEHGRNSIYKMIQQSTLQFGKQSVTEALEIVKQHVEEGKAS